MVGTEATCTGSFEDAFGILPSLFTLLPLYVVLKFLPVSDRP